ncbi:MAG: hypothetical protein AB1349_11455 [Elusimicrobiota bacterium]
MKIAIIGTKGWSYAGHEDLIREMGWRFVEDGHKFVIHAWAQKKNNTYYFKDDVIQNGVKRVFHKTSDGKFLGQLIVAFKSSLKAAFSDCDLIYYAFIQNGIYSWIPRLLGKKIVCNVNGIMWKDPKWPIIFRHIFFPLGAYLTYFISHKTITDSLHMQELYKKKFKMTIDWIGYGCDDIVPGKKEIDLVNLHPNGYYLIMSRITPHNLTDIMIEGYLKSGSKKDLVIAGHIPNNLWFRSIKKKCENKSISFLGLISDQDYLTQIILNSCAYLHGHSLGGINPALVRVTGLDKPVICIDTIFNREVVEYPNRKLQAIVFIKNYISVANAIQKYENNEVYFTNEAKNLGSKIRATMSWGKIYQKYLMLFKSM